MSVKICLDAIISFGIKAATCVTVGAVLFMAGSARAEPLDGRWYGELGRERGPMQIVVDIQPEDEGLVAYLSVPSQDVRGIRVGPVEVDDDGVVSFFMESSSAPFGFAGRREDGRLAGTLRQGATLFDAWLGREAPARVDSAPDPVAAMQVVDSQIAAYNAHDVEAFVRHFDEAAEIHAYLGERQGRGHEEIAATFTRTFQNEPHLVVDERISLGNTVIDKVSITFSSGTVRAMVIIYNVQDGLISSLTYVL